jgi:hypothetical protein
MKLTPRGFRTYLVQEACELREDQRLLSRRSQSEEVDELVDLVTLAVEAIFVFDLPNGSLRELRGWRHLNKIRFANRATIL